MIKDHEYIVVNATALDKSGALSILKQFVANIPSDNRRWLLFVSPLVSLSSHNPNVWIEPIQGVKPMHKRLWWDTLGLKKWLKRNNINPIASISLQNTGFNVGRNVPTYLYYHQSIPFFPFRWNPLRRNERTFWFYKNVYPFFVNLFLKRDTKVFVQLEFIKKGFIRRFDHDPNLIRVFSPSVIKPERCIMKVGPRESDTLRLIFPATPHFYKNHRIIDEALRFTDINAEVLFTFEDSTFSFRDKRIRLIGMQSYDKLCELYQSTDALLFPSYIETFGLPLLEAAMIGVPIIVADLPYAREVLDGYRGVQFVAFDKPEAWAEAMDKLKKGKRYDPISIKSRPGWKELFKQINDSNE